MHGAVNLVSLPNELLGQILDVVQNKASLAAVARTCHALRDIAEARLYSHLTIEKREALAYLGNATSARPKRDGFVRRLDLLFGGTVYGDILVDMTTADTVAALFPRLKSLTIESPF
ncbi:hypothetical protein PG999_000229 [Apiospora kogelbergensis]|uniref:F-box domain-containing protein n=1 Tax=Apiospora kogelbergensis TaxID=1337665 RepID=A0AAW0RB19_9PEZI